jgi:hypothetical protein
VPSTATINSNQTRNNTVTMSVTKNASFLGQVFTSAFPNWGEPTHPWGTTLTPLTFSPSPMTPDGSVAWSTFETTGAPQGVYTVWIQGHSPSPALIDHFYPVGISIGSVNRDFSTSGGAAVLIPSTGGTGTTGVTVSTPNNNGTYFGGTVTLSVEGGPDALVPGTLPTGIGTVSVSPSTITLNKGTSQTATVSINGGTLGPGVYSLTLRVTGSNSAGQPVTRMVPITVAIATASTTDEYVDILGFTTFRITSMDSNAVYGYAISGVYADMNDPALRRGQVARLVPWN